MEKKNRLPEYWAVLNDGSEEFKEIINYRNKISEGNWLGYNTHSYYGYDGRYFDRSEIRLFKNNPTLLTIAQFIELSQDVEEPTPADTFQKITDSLAKVLREKNKRYGNSALAPLEIFGGKSKVGTRLDDKLARIKNSEVLRVNDVVDTIGYLVLVCQENGWDNFDNQLD